MGKLDQVIDELNRGRLGFVNDRAKGEITELLGREVTIENIAFVTSKFDDRENVVFTVREEPGKFYRSGSAAVVDGLKRLKEALEEEGRSWDALAIKVVEQKNKEGRRYFAIKARKVSDGFSEEEESFSEIPEFPF